MKPVIFAMMNKRTRARTLMHDVRESEYVSVLSGFGITKGMLPTDMGGDVAVDVSAWIANRRAEEMKEI